MDLMELAVKVSIDSKAAEQGLKKTEEQGKKTSGRLNKWLSEIGKGALRELGAQLTKLPGMIKNVFGSAMNLAGELEQNLGGASAVFGDYFNDIQKSAESAYNKIGLSQSKYLSYANKMGSLLQGSGYTQAEALTETTRVMQRASDVASIMGLSVEDAMTAVAGAAKGNFTINNIVRSAA